MFNAVETIPYVSQCRKIDEPVYQEPSIRKISLFHTSQRARIEWVNGVGTVLYV